MSDWEHPRLLKFFPECGHSYLWIAAREVELRSLLPTAECLERLEEILSRTSGYESFRPDRFPANSWEWNIRFYVSDLLEKLGFLYLARDKIKDIEDTQRAQAYKTFEAPFVKYYVYNFVYDCQAFLDALAGLLNYHFNLGFSEGVRLDFNKHKFRQKLASTSAELSRTIEKHIEWIKDLSEWRIKLIHRHGILVFGSLTGYKYSLPQKPLKYTEYYVAQEKGTQDCVDFCKNHIEHAQEIFGVSCKAILRTVKEH